MKYEEFKKLQGKVRKKPSNIEHTIQCYCVSWFRASYPTLRKLLFAVPNGGRRDAVTGANLKAEGATAGVSDLILLVPNQQYHALCIEMKTEKGTQQDSQKEWQSEVEKQGYRYVVCRSVEEFIQVVTSYMDFR